MIGQGGERLAAVPCDRTAAELAQALGDPVSMLPEIAERLHALGLPVAAIYVAAARESLGHALGALERDECMTARAEPSAAARQAEDPLLTDWLS